MKKIILPVLLCGVLLNPVIPEAASYARSSARAGGSNHSSHNMVMMGAVTGAVIASSASNKAQAASGVNATAPANAFIKCDADMPTGQCNVWQGCSIAEKISIEEYLHRQKPNATLVGISIDSYKSDIYIYYNQPTNHQ